MTVPDEMAAFSVPDLSETEQNLVDAFLKGERLDLRSPGSRSVDPAKIDEWSADRRLRATVIAALAIGDLTPKAGIRAKISVAGALIIGDIDLADSDIHWPLELIACFFEGAVYLNDARMRTVDLSESWFKELSASSATVDGHMILIGCRSCMIDMSQSHVSGRLMLDGAQINNSGGAAFVGDGLVVDGAMYCRGGLQVRGEFRLIAATVRGYLAMIGATFLNPGAVAVAADSLAVNGNMILSGQASVEGEFRLVGAHITGQLAFGQAKVSNQASIAINCNFAMVDGNLSCTGNLRVDGETCLIGASIRGELELSGGIFSNPGGCALRADRVTVYGPMACSGRFKAIGETRLLGAHISGQLLLDGGELLNLGGFALNADGLVADGDVFCQNGFLAKGEMRFANARIAGQLGFQGATLVQPAGRAIQCQEAQIGSLWIDDAIISGGVDLTEADVRTLSDRQTAWPRRLEMDRFVYGSLFPDRPIGGPTGRLAWLERSQEYRPQPYEQLAAYCRRLGHDKDARDVLLAKNRRHRASLPRNHRLPGWIWDKTVGYGYRPLRALGWVLAIGAAGTTYFSTYPPAPVNPVHHPHYQAILYVADLMLPVINLGQSSVWNPLGLGQWIAAALTVLGWVFAIAIVAGITRTLSRD